MKVFVAADHNGFGLKADVLEYLGKAGYQAEDAGDRDYNPDDDFPVFASEAIHKLFSSTDQDPRAVLICGSGQGMVMAANRFKGVRAGLGWSIEAAKAIRNDEDSNVLALPAELFREDKQRAFVILEAWLNTSFAGAARYNRRNQELDQLS